MPDVARGGVAGACHSYGVLCPTGGQVLAWGTEADNDKTPQTWADFWDAKAFLPVAAPPNTGTRPGRPAVFCTPRMVSSKPGADHALCV